MKATGDESSDQLLHAVAGAVGSAFALFLTYPLYLGTLKLQADHGAGTLVGESAGSRSFFGVLLDAVRCDGFKGLFRGCSEGLLATTATSFVYYYAFAAWKQWHRAPDASPFWNLVTAYEAGVVAVFFTHPLWVLNYQLATDQKSPAILPPRLGAPALRGLQQRSQWRVQTTALQIHQDHGISGFYRGVTPAVVLCVNPALQFFTYTASAHVVKRFRERRRRGPWHALSSVDIFLLGAWAKAVASSITYPLQTIKTSLSKAHGAGGSFTGSFEVCRTIIVCEGMQGLFKGLRGKLLQTTLTAAITFSIRLRLLESLRWVLTRHRRTHRRAF